MAEQNRTAEEIKAQLAAYQGRATYDPNTPLPGSSGQSTSGGSYNAIIDYMTERLTNQGQGISSSASSNLQASIEEAIAGTQQAGALSSQALQSQRQREVGFAQDRASAQFAGAMEGRSGYATQVVALRELTDTTEKSIRDLDMRYQEAILTNDAATAQRVADLQVKKLEFLQQQEQNFYQNLFQLGNLTQQQLQMQQQSEQFWANQEQQADQFAQQMKQSDYQFEKNLGIQYQELGLKEQELQIAWDRNAISREELNLRKSEINKEKNFTTTQGLVQQRLISMAKAGALEGMDPLTIASSLRAELEGSGFKFDGTTEEFSTIVMQSYLNVKGAGIVPDTPDEPKRQYSTIGGFLDYHFGNHPFYRNTGQYTSNQMINQGIVEQQNINKAKEDLARGFTISAP